MTYTTDQAIALALEHFADPDGSLVFLTPELTAFANAVRKQTLLEAADALSNKYEPLEKNVTENSEWTYQYGYDDCADELRRMAGEE